MDLIQWDRVALPLVLCFGIFVQAAAGFGAGLVIVPSLLWVGYDLPSAMAAMLVATIAQNAQGVWKFREFIDPRQIVGPAAARLLFLPLGIFCLYRLESVSPVAIRQVVGGFVLVATLTTMWQVQPRHPLSRWWAVLVFPLSGFLQGLVGMGGPPIVLWIQAQRWSTERSRGFLFAMFLVAVIPAIAALYVTFGRAIVPGGIAAAATTVLLWPSTALGLRVGSWLGRDRLRVVTMGLLILVGLAGILSPWMRG